MRCDHTKNNWEWRYASRGSALAAVVECSECGELLLQHVSGKGIDQIKWFDLTATHKYRDSIFKVLHNAKDAATIEGFTLALVDADDALGEFHDFCIRNVCQELNIKIGEIK